MSDQVASASPPPDPPPPRRRRLRRALRLAGIVVLLGLAIDLARPPERQWTAGLLLGGIDLYQATLSPYLARGGVRCRFTPTCSHYGAAAIRQRGALVGSALAAWRVLRCGPWTAAGTVDPPPSGRHGGAPGAPPPAPPPASPARVG